MAAGRSFRQVVVLLLLSGVLGDSIGNASDVSDTPSTSTNRITSSSITPTITVSSIFKSPTLANTTTDSSNVSPTSEVVNADDSGSGSGSGAVTTVLHFPSISSSVLMTIASITMTPLPSTSLPLPTSSSVLQMTTISTMTVMVSSSSMIVPPSSMTVSLSLSPSSMTVTQLPTLTQPSLPSSNDIFTVTTVLPSSVTSMSIPSVLSTDISSVAVTPSLSSVTTSVSNIPTATPTSKSKAEENRKLLLYIGPPAGLLVLICVLIGTVLCIRRYRRIRKWRLQLMPLHNLVDNADSDEEELLNDDQAPTFQVSDEARQPILTFDE